MLDYHHSLLIRGSAVLQQRFYQGHGAANAASSEDHLVPLLAASDDVVLLVQRHELLITRCSYGEVGGSAAHP